MKFMVCRKDAVDRSIKSSELFPVIVDVPIDATYEDVVLQALHGKWPEYYPKNKSYYVIPMDEAKLVSFVPKQDYDIRIENV